MSNAAALNSLATDTRAFSRESCLSFRYHELWKKQRVIERTGRGGEIRTRDHLHPMQVGFLDITTA